MAKGERRDEAKKIAQARVLVIGDVILDLYVRGDTHRISPEAPVPIVLETSREYSLGGAGNVAHNISAVGAQASLLGAVGKDREGEIVRRLAEKYGIRPRLVREQGRPTSLKTRAVVGHHQLLRIDREHAHEFSEQSQIKLVRAVQNIHSHDFVVLSDYVKGLLTKEIVEAARNRFGGDRIIANIKPSSNVKNYRNLAAVTMNAKEGHDLTGTSGTTDADAARALRALAKIFSSSVVMTRGERGMSIYDRNENKISHISSVALTVFDVAGAGDTVAAIVGLLRGAGIPLLRAAEIANQAAGIVVGMRGTAVLRRSDMRGILRA